jgi:hypothetical protein
MISEKHNQQRKTQLLEENKLTENAIQEKVENLRTDFLHKAKIGITIGLVSFGGYWIVRQLLGNPIHLKDLFSENDENHYNKADGSEVKSLLPVSTDVSEEWDLVRMIKKEIAKFVVAVVRSKLQELIEILTQPQDQDIEQDIDYEEDTTP